MREDNILGIPMTVIDDEDVPDLEREREATGITPLHVCQRVEDARWFEVEQPPYPALAGRRVIKQCADCGEDIWSDPASVPNGLTVISKCIRCSMGAEFAAALGREIVRIRARMSQ